MVTLSVPRSGPPEAPPKLLVGSTYWNACGSEACRVTPSEAVNSAAPTVPDGTRSRATFGPSTSQSLTGRPLSCTCNEASSPLPYSTTDAPPA